jgi:hypothetical protein
MYTRLNKHDVHRPQTYVDQRRQTMYRLDTSHIHTTKFPSCRWLTHAYRWDWDWVGLGLG